MYKAHIKICIVEILLEKHIYTDLLKLQCASLLEYKYKTWRDFVGSHLQTVAKFVLFK
jgi:hypothetical protein